MAVPFSTPHPVNEIGDLIDDSDPAVILIHPQLEGLHLSLNKERAL